MADYDFRIWQYGPPPSNNANFAWLQLILERLGPGGRAAVVMPNGALSSANPREWYIRKRMVEDGCVEALISLPPKIFRNTKIPVTIWLLKKPGSAWDEILLIDASGAGRMIDRSRREIDDSEIAEIIKIVDDWRGGRLIESSIPATPAPPAEIRAKDYNLNPSAYSSTLPGEANTGHGELPIRQLLRRLEVYHADASAKDAAASLALKDLKW